MYTESEVVAVMSRYTGILAIICLFVGVVYSYYHAECKHCGAAL